MKMKSRGKENNKWIFMLSRTAFSLQKKEAVLLVAFQSNFKTNWDFGN